MAEADENSVFWDDRNTAVEELDDDFIPADALPVCHRCFEPCHPLQHYCDNCDSADAINPLATYMPFVNIRFNCGIFATIWRKIFYDVSISKIAKLFWLSILIATIPGILIFGIPAFLISKIYRPKTPGTKP